MPSAINPVIEIWRMMLKMLMGSMKLGFSAVNTIISTTRNSRPPAVPTS